jgi:hypothetical protein
MSEHGQVCGICGAHGDYCQLEAASGLSIDCRQLQLKNPDDLQGNIEMAQSLREALVETDPAMSCPECARRGRRCPSCTKWAQAQLDKHQKRT